MKTRTSLVLFAIGVLAAVIQLAPAQDFGDDLFRDPAATRYSATSGSSDDLFGDSVADDRPTHEEDLATDAESKARFEKDRTLERESRRLIERYRRADSADLRTNLQQQLQRVVAEHFDVRQNIRELELKQLEQQLRRLQELHRRRQQQRDAIVRNRVEQLIRDADGLGWGNTTTRGLSGFAGSRNGYWPDWNSADAQLAPVLNQSR